VRTRARAKCRLAALVAHVHVEPAGVALKAIETAFAWPGSHCCLHAKKDATFGTLVIGIAFHLKIHEGWGARLAASSSALIFSTR